MRVGQRLEALGGLPKTLEAHQLRRTDWLAAHIDHDVTSNGPLRLPPS
jgi:hypothetical protein